MTPAVVPLRVALKTCVLVTPTEAEDGATVMVGEVMVIVAEAEMPPEAEAVRVTMLVLGTAEGAW